MTNYIAVIPYIHRPYFEECVKTLKIPSQEIVAIDNTENNIGVAASWNRGIDALRRYNRDWLIIISAAMRFGQASGLDMIEQLETHRTSTINTYNLKSADILRFARKDITERPFNMDNKANNPSYPDCFYWHCTAISRQVVERVGKFDANFYPIYFEDTDYDLRIKKTGFRATDFIVPIDAESVGLRHGVELADLKVGSDPSIAYFATKWGRHPSAAELGEYDTPFNDPNNSLAFWPGAHGEVWNE